MGFRVNFGRLVVLGLISFAVVSCMPPVVLAQTWDGDNGNPGDNNWSNALNWSPDGTPLNNGSADIIFAGPNKLTPNLDSAWDINSLTFGTTAGPFAIGGSTTTIRTGGITNSSSNTQIFSNSLILGASQTWMPQTAQILFNGASINTQGFTLTVGGASNATIASRILGSGSLIKTGSNTVTVTQNSQTNQVASVSILAGTLSLTNYYALYTGPVVTIGDTSGSADAAILTSSECARSINVQAGSSGNAIIGGISSGGQFDGTITLNKNAFFSSALSNSTNFIGLITGPGGFTKTGAGTVILSGNVANNYNGTTTISDGTLVLQNTANAIALAPTIVTVGDGTGTDALNVSAAGQIHPSTDFVVNSSGIFNLGNNSVAIHNLTLNGGTIAGSGSLALGGTLSLAGGAITGINLQINSDVSAGSSATGAIIGTLNLNGTRAFTVADGPATTDLDLAGVVSNGGIIKNGPGALRLLGVNTFAGGFNLNAGTLVFSATNATLGTGTLTIAGGAIQCDGPSLFVNPVVMNGDLILSGTVVTAFNGSVALTGNRAIISNNSGTISFGGVISENALGKSLAKSGQGFLRLTGANTFTGGFLLSGGTLALGNDLALGSGTFNFQGGSVQADSLRLISNPLVAGGSISFSGSQAMTFINGGTLSANSTLNSDGTGVTTISGPLVESVPGTSFTKSGTGVLVLSGHNTYSGTTRIESSGTLRVLGGDAIPDISAVTLAATGAILDLQGGSETIGSIGGGSIGANNVSLGANGALTVGTDNTSAAPFVGNITGSGTAKLTKVGTGVLTLGGASTYTGATELRAGTITLSGGANRLPTTTVLTLGFGTDSGTLDLNGQSQTLAGLGTSGTGSLNLITSAAGTPILTINAATSSTYLGAINGSVGLTKTGASVLTLGGANSYSGITRVENGTLQAIVDNAFSTGTANVIGTGAGVTATLDLNGFKNTVSAITLGGSTITSSAAVATGTGTLTIVGNVTFDATNNPLGGVVSGRVTLGAGTRTISVGDSTSAAVDLTISASIAGDAITKTGAGALALTAANVLTGPVTLSTGTILLGDDSALGQGTFVIAGGGVQSIGSSRIIANPITLNGNCSIGGSQDLTLSSGIVLSGDRTLAIDNAGITTLGGAITQDIPGRKLTKGGNGQLVLSGTNTFSGGLILNTGTLAIGNNAAAGTATLTLVGGAVQADGAPRSIANPVSITGSVTIGGSQSLTFSGNTVGSGSGILTVNSAGAITFGNLSMSNVVTLTAGTLTANATQSAGTFSQTGGVFNGTLTVQSGSTFNYSAGVFNGRLINSGIALINNLVAGDGIENYSTISASGTSLTINGSGLLNYGVATFTDATISGTGGITNDFAGRLVARGAFQTPLINNGSLDLTGLLTLGGTSSNLGAIAIGNTESLRTTAGMSNFGLITMSAASISGGGTVTNGGGGVIQGSGGVSAPLINSGGLINAVGASGSQLTMTNLVGGNVGGGELRVADSNTLRILNAFGNSSLITLQGAGASLAGGTISNTGSVIGIGRITNAISNAGVIRAQGGQLTLSGTGITNTLSGHIEATVGASILMSQGLAANAGVISVNGGTFDNNGQALINSGFVNGHGTIRTGGITNNNSVTFADSPTDVFGSFANVTSGSISATLNVINSTTTFYDPVTNGTNSIIKNTDGVIRFLASYTNNGTYSSDPADNYFGNVSNAPSGVIRGGAGDHFFVDGSFDNQGTYLASSSLLKASVVSNTGTFTHDSGTFSVGGSFTNTGTATIGGVQTWGGTSTFNATGGSTQFLTDAGSRTSKTLSLTAANAGCVVSLKSNQHLRSINVGTLAVVRMEQGAPKVLVTGSVSTSGGQLDLVKNSMVVDYDTTSPATSITSQLSSGFSGGAWGGTGITSSAAAAQAQNTGHPTGLGVAEASRIFASFPAIFQSEAVDSTSVLLRYTWSGDANLDGTVNSADFNTLSAHFNFLGSFWQDGDFNYDGKVNLLDFNAIAINFGQSLASPSLGTVVPEPISVSSALVASVAFGFCRRSRRYGF